MKNRLSQATLDFLNELQQNNQRDWFQENKARYEAAKADFLELVQNVIDAVGASEPALKEQQAKDTMFRIYRDVRFSSNKNPYKDHFGAYMAEGGRKSVYPGYYLHISPNDQSFLAGGLWMPPPAELKAVRQEIDYNFDEIRNIIEAPDFKKKFGNMEGEKLKTNPKGYDAENPAIELLRHKSWTVSSPLPDALLTRDNLFEKVLDLIKTVKPLNDFLIRPLHDLADKDE